MAIPKINEKNIEAAIEYIDKNGIPDRNKSTQYVLITEDGKQYPPKYVIAVADYLANGTDIVTDGFNTVEAKNYFETRGYNIESKQEKFELTITATQVTSSDDRFTMDNLGLGDNYRPIDAYFVSAEGDIVRRKYNKGERRNTNQTLPRLACQIFENQLVSLSAWDKEKFPICKYTPDKDTICGIFSTVEEFLKYKNSMEYLTYQRENGPRFVIYAWNVFSTLIFVQECLKRFGKDGDKFVLMYRDKTEQEKNQATNGALVEAEEKKSVEGCKNPYSKILLESKNVIFRGAPGTGKSFLAKAIAADIISDGYTDKYTDLSDEQKQQVEFVQFHPSYDYSDFVEGLRPKMNEDGTMGFELQDGIFKKFAEKARKNFESSKKSKELVEQEISAKAAMTDFFASIEFGEDVFRTIKGSEFTITSVDDRHIDISIPGNATIDKLSLNIEELQKMLASDVIFEKISDITNFFGKQFATQAYSYDFAIYKEIKSRSSANIKLAAIPEIQKKYIFIIDEINRGEISKILGELFFSIDPGYRGKAGEVATQYSNMHVNPNDKFYIPENVYIIGTMNDIDRSVDSFDFAMRRRFRFVEVRAEDTQDMLESLENEELKVEAIARMDKLNVEIIKVPDLNENYQIGASYFLKLKNLSFDELWTDYLQPLLQDYVRGLSDEEECMRRFARAYGYKALSEGETDETAQD
ncbi:MAG: AAA family ATPase [Lachnospiraceae bacterium]|nr:AAA family ATPase [Lachnospiraceae bacterium]